MAHVKMLLELDGSLEDISRQTAVLLGSGLVRELRPIGPCEDPGEYATCPLVEALIATRALEDGDETVDPQCGLPKQRIVTVLVPA